MNFTAQDSAAGRDVTWTKVQLTHRPLRTPGTLYHVYDALELPQGEEIESSVQDVPVIRLTAFAVTPVLANSRSGGPDDMLLPLLIVVECGDRDR